MGLLYLQKMTGTLYPLSEPPSVIFQKEVVYWDWFSLYYVQIIKW